MNYNIKKSIMNYHIRSNLYYVEVKFYDKIMSTILYISNINNYEVKLIKSIKNDIDYSNIKDELYIFLYKKLIDNDKYRRIIFLKKNIKYKIIKKYDNNNINKFKNIDKHRIIFDNIIEFVNNIDNEILNELLNEDYVKKYFHIIYKKLSDINNEILYRDINNSYLIIKNFKNYYIHNDIKYRIIFNNNNIYTYIIINNDNLFKLDLYYIYKYILKKLNIYEKYIIIGGYHSSNFLGNIIKNIYNSDDFELIAENFELYAKNAFNYYFKDGFNIINLNSYCVNSLNDSAH